MGGLESFHIYVFTTWIPNNSEREGTKENERLEQSNCKTVQNDGDQKKI